MPDRALPRRLETIMKERIEVFNMAPTTSTEQKKNDEKNETKKGKGPKKKEEEPEMVK